MKIFFFSKHKNNKKIFFVSQYKESAVQPELSSSAQTWDGKKSGKISKNHFFQKSENLDLFFFFWPEKIIFS